MLRIKEAEILDSQLHILSQIDYKYFEKVGSLPSPPEKRERVRYLCGYLNVSDLRLLSQPGFLVSFRAQAHKDDPKYVINANAWVQTAMNHAEKESVSAFSVQRLRDSIPEIREMTLREPGEFLPDLKKTLSQCGVSFVLIPDLKNSGIFGAVKWTGRNSVVLAMNDRHSQVDTFWFSLFHEIRHVMQQKVTSVFIGMEEEELSEKTRIWEEDADRFASDTLIPPKEYRHLLEKEWLSDAAIISFASSISIHPGIVVGRLQHDGIIPFSRCAGLKEKYSFF